MSREPALRIPDELLGGQPAHALNKAPFDLADVDCRINAVAYIVKNIDALNDIFTREGVDLDLTAGSPER
jgi:hypothetical protein